MARRWGRKPVITHQQVCDRLKRMEDTLNEFLAQKSASTFDIQVLVAERDYWKKWAINNGWAHNG